MKLLNRFILCLPFLLIFSACDKDCEDGSVECEEKQLTKDIQIIQNYLEDSSLVAERHPSDLFYIIEQEGTGDLPNQGQTIVANYTGKFLDGRVFDTSIESVAREAGIYNSGRNYAPFSFILGNNNVVRGWEIAFSLFNEGTKATILMPSSLAYGFKGRGSIPPNTVLLFEVELVNIRF
jgi:FKBP-type peptidyl-prolyl cis-trans isomerase